MNKKIKQKILLLLAGMSLFVQPAFSQTIEKLWPDGVPGSIINKEFSEQFASGQMEWMTNPEMLVFLPEEKYAKSTGILICPGGAYGGLAWEHEGTSIAKWLNAKGITAFVLKYRLPSDKIMKDKSIGPLQDAQQAIRIIRKNAEQWNVNPAKIGVMGFSAGGHLAATLSTLYNEKLYEAKDISARPDFTILVYPLISFDPSITHQDSKMNLLGSNPGETMMQHSSADKQVDANTPPAFIVHASDDGCVPVKHSLLYYEALQKCKVPVEMHLYQSGGHGFGLGGNGTVAEWGNACLLWMKENGW